MKHHELVKAVAAETELNQSIVKAVLTKLAMIIREEVTAGEDVIIADLGTFDEILNQHGQSFPVFKPCRKFYKQVKEQASNEYCHRVNKT